MKFGHIDWKILAFTIEKIVFLNVECLAILDDFDCHLWNFFALQTLNFKKIMLKN